MPIARQQSTHHACLLIAASPSADLMSSKAHFICSYFAPLPELRHTSPLPIRCAEVCRQREFLKEKLNNYQVFVRLCVCASALFQSTFSGKS